MERTVIPTRYLQEINKTKVIGFNPATGSLILAHVRFEKLADYPRAVSQLVYSAVIAGFDGFRWPTEPDLMCSYRNLSKFVRADHLPNRSLQFCLQPEDDFFLFPQFTVTMFNNSKPLTNIYKYRYINSGILLRILTVNGNNADSVWRDI